MKWEEVGSVPCSVARTLAVVGERWTLLIVRDAFLGVRRFEDFQRGLGLTRHLLAARLRKLEEHGVLERHRYQERPDRFEYRLSERGIDLYPILLALVRWGDRWTSDADGPPMLYRHRSCGHVAIPALHCADCGEPVSARDLVPFLNPNSAAAKTADVSEAGRD